MKKKLLDVDVNFLNRYKNQSGDIIFDILVTKEICLKNWCDKKSRHIVGPSARQVSSYTTIAACAIMFWASAFALQTLSAKSATASVICRALPLQDTITASSCTSVTHVTLAWARIRRSNGNHIAADTVLIAAASQADRPATRRLRHGHQRREKRHQTQPCRQTLSFCSSRHAMICVALENTASISTSSIGSVGSSGWITRLTKKCFCLAMGMTAVHLVSSSFLGFKGSAHELFLRNHIKAVLYCVFFGSVWATWVRPFCRVNDFNDLR